MYARQQLLLWLSLCLCAVVSSLNAEDEQEQQLTSAQPEEHARRLAHIYSLAEHCLEQSGGTHCGGFNYNSSEEVAFFDMPTEVRIAPDGATYQLGSTQSVDTITFENSSFVHFPLHLFYVLELSELDMRNCSVEHVSWESFLMANKLVLLLLSDNLIQTLEPETFSFASELQFLFLSRNRLQSLDSRSFLGLDKLRHLDLSGNQLEELPAGLFDDLAALQELNLAENRLRSIANDLFAHNSRLLTVTLHTNELRELGEYAFRTPPDAEQQQQQLHAVDLSHNRQLSELVLNLSSRYLWARNCSLSRVNLYGSLTNVDLRDNRLMELYFSAPESLEYLTLRNNSLSQLAALSRVDRLRHLDVADNPGLHELPLGWQTPALEKLDMSNTSHTQLPLLALDGMPQLRKLNISANKLSEIEPKAFQRLSQLTHFYIHANSWNCYNLNLIMDLLIRPYGISYTVDAFDPEFPGEYINGIACMYRLPENEDNETGVDSDSDTIAAASVEQAQKLSIEPTPALTEVSKLRQEFKAVIQIMEQKFDRVFEQLNQLNAKMQSLERWNSTLWNQVTITV